MVDNEPEDPAHAQHTDEDKEEGTEPPWFVVVSLIAACRVVNG